MTLCVLGLSCFNHAYGQDLVQVNGVAPVCVVNQRYQVQHPGAGTPFGTPQYGICSGSIQQNCTTGDNAVHPNVCIGTFTSWAAIEAQRAVDLANFQQKMQSQMDELTKNLKTLSDSIDAQTKRLNAIEAAKPKTTAFSRNGSRSSRHTSFASQRHTSQAAHPRRRTADPSSKARTPYLVATSQP